MIIKILKPKSLFFATDCDVVINGKKYIVDKDLSIDIEESTVDFYVSMFYLRTKTHTLSNGNSFTIQIDRILNRRKFLIVCLIAISLLILNYFFNNYYFNVAFKIFMYMFFGFIFLINTIFSKYFFKVKIVKN